MGRGGAVVSAVVVVGAMVAVVGAKWLDLCRSRVDVTNVTVTTGHIWDTSHRPFRAGAHLPQWVVLSDVFESCEEPPHARHGNHRLGGIFLAEFCHGAF